MRPCRGFHIQIAMKTYELSYIVSPEITSEEAQAKAKEIESAISAREGVLLRQSDPIAKTLAYPISKRASGFFGVLEFQLEPEKVVEIEEIVAKDGKIVRHMLIIRKPQRPRKERRARVKPALEIEQKIEIESVKKEKSAAGKGHTASATKEKEKVELKDIEHELDEILGD